MARTSDGPEGQLLTLGKDQAVRCEAGREARRWSMPHMALSVAMVIGHSPFVAGVSSELPW